MKTKKYIISTLVLSVLCISACSSKIDNNTKENPNTEIEKTQNSNYVFVEDKSRKPTTYTGTPNGKNTYIEILGVQAVDGYVSYQSGMLMVEDVAGKMFTLPVNKTFSIYDDRNLSRQDIPKVPHTKNVACKEEKDESGMYLVSPHCFGEDKNYIYARKTDEEGKYVLMRIRKK